MTQDVKFDISESDRKFRDRVVKRAAIIAKSNDRSTKFDGLSASMDLTACHANGCPLDFKRLSEADDFNLMHDVVGIERHLDRDTGKLTNHFLPRFALRESMGGSRVTTKETA